MGTLLPNIKQRFFDDNGDPLVGGKLYSYIAGTTTPLATYSDDEVTPNTNPVVLDGDGRADVWLAAGSYKFVLKNSSDVTLWTVDDILISSSSSTVSGGWSSPAEHSITDGQAATALSGESWTAASYSSVPYEFEIIRGTTVISSGRIICQDLNGTWRIVESLYDGEAHGVTWSLSGTTTQQLNAALDSGAGNGTIKLSRKLIPA